MAQLKAVIFDFDGVIIDSEPLHFEIEKQIFNKLGLNLSEEEFMSYSGISEKETYEALSKKYNMPLDVNGILEEKIELFQKMVSEADSLPLNAGLKPLLQALSSAKVRLSIATSGTLEICEAVIYKAGIREYFSLIVSGADVKKSKPSPEVYEKSLKKLDLNPEACLVIEDSENGIKAAKAADIKVIALITKTNSQIDRTIPDKTVGSLEDIGLDFLTDLLNKHQ